MSEARLLAARFRRADATLEACQSVGGKLYGVADLFTGKPMTPRDTADMLLYLRKLAGELYDASRLPGEQVPHTQAGEEGGGA